MRPYYLDGDLAQRDPILHAEHIGLVGPGDTRFSAAAYRWRLMWHCAVFKDRGEAYNAGRSRVLRSRHVWRVHAITGGRRSLKTQQHAGIVCGLAGLAPE
jgi:hypothetical protein